jgi:hypothetical protein
MVSMNYKKIASSSAAAAGLLAMTYPLIYGFFNRPFMVGQ